MCNNLANYSKKVRIFSKIMKGMTEKVFSFLVILCYQSSDDSYTRVVPEFLFVKDMLLDRFLHCVYWILVVVKASLHRSPSYFMSCII